MEGKVIIKNDPTPGFLKEGKDSLRESFIDAKEELASGTSAETLNKVILQTTPVAGKMLSMEIDGVPSNSKCKTTDSDGRISVPKIYMAARKAMAWEIHVGKLTWLLIPFCYASYVLVVSWNFCFVSTWHQLTVYEKNDGITHSMFVWQHKWNCPNLCCQRNLGPYYYNLKKLKANYFFGWYAFNLLVWYD